MQKKKTVGWKYVWVFESKILASKEDGSRVIHIRSESDISKMC